MALQPIEKKYREMELGAGEWSRTKNADGSTTYTATAAATAKFTFENGDEQNHVAIPIGKKITTKDGVADLWEMY